MNIYNHCLNHFPALLLTAAILSLFMGFSMLYLKLAFILWCHFNVYNQELIQKQKNKKALFIKARKNIPFCRTGTPHTYYISWTRTLCSEAPLLTYLGKRRSPFLPTHSDPILPYWQNSYWVHPWPARSRRGHTLSHHGLCTPYMLPGIGWDKNMQQNSGQQTWGEVC